MSIDNATPAEWDSLRTNRQPSAQSTSSPSITLSMDPTPTLPPVRVTLDVSASERKGYPLYSGLIAYFPNALAEVAKVSQVGAIQHGQDPKDIFRDLSKVSVKGDLDAMMRHLLDAGYTDTDGLRHTAKLAWRALSALEEELKQ